MKPEDIRTEAVEDEVAAEVPNVPDDIYSDTPAGDDIPVLTLDDTGVDAPVLISDEEDAAVEISDAREVDEAAEESADGGDDSVADAEAPTVTTDDAIAVDEDTDKPAADDDITDKDEDIGIDNAFDESNGTADISVDESDKDTDKSTSLSGSEAVAEDTPTKKAVAVAKPHSEEKKSNVKDKVGERKVDGLFDFIELFVFTLAIVLFVTSFFVRQSVVDGDSMLGTLHDKETLLISDFLYEPRRGDIVVVDDRSAYSVPIIKRVIAVGGDTVRITKVGVIVNGELLDEPYVYTDGGKYEYRVEYRDIADVIKGYDTLKYKDGEYYEFVVPEGKIFVLGDHRNASTDSRTIGPVDVDAVLGRVIYRILPFSVFGPVE